MIFKHFDPIPELQAYVGTTPNEFASATAGIVEVAYGKQGEREDV